jgi:hypothetical protein
MIHIILSEVTVTSQVTVTSVYEDPMNKNNYIRL